MEHSLYQTVVNTTYDHIPLTTVGSLHTVSFALEDASLLSGPVIDLAVGFQSWSRMTPQLERYQALSKICRSVYIYGMADSTPPTLPNATFVPLEAHWPLAVEWFVIVRASGLRAALLAEEIPTVDGRRQFRACFSSDAAAVEHCLSQLATDLPAPAPTDLPLDGETQREHLDMVKGRLIMHQEQRLLHAVERQRKAAQRAEEIRELIGMLPQFSDHADWQRLLTEHVRRAATAML
jgi:hypothetical protein